MEVRGLLLDSGGTMIGPRGGRWNPRFDFESLLLRRWPDVPADRFAEAFATGQRFMDEYPGTPPYEDYYRVIFEDLGLEADMSDEELLAEFLPPVEAHDVIEVLPGTREALAEFERLGLPMVVVSDAWAGLDDVYGALGLRQYFQGFVISQVVGCCKPDPRMYRAGSDLLGLPPAECLFVDDGPDLVEAAIGLGYQGRAICLDGAPRPSSVPSVTSLLELVDSL